MNPVRRGAEGYYGQTHRRLTQRRRPCERDANSHQKLEEAKKNPLEPVEEMWPCPQLDFRLQKYEEKNVCCFRPSSL